MKLSELILKLQICQNGLGGNIEVEISVGGDGAIHSTETFGVFYERGIHRIDGYDHVWITDSPMFEDGEIEVKQKWPL